MVSAQPPSQCSDIGCNSGRTAPQNTWYGEGASAACETYRSTHLSLCTDDCGGLWGQDVCGSLCAPDLEEPGSYTFMCCCT